MNKSRPTANQRPTLTDEELGSLIRDAAEAWRQPPERLDHRAWVDRANRNRVLSPIRLAATVGVAILATLALALAAPYLGLLRQIGAGPTGSPSPVGATPSTGATPLPKIALYGDPLPMTRLLVGDWQYSILDLRTGDVAGPIGPGPGCDSIGRMADGSIGCALVGRLGAGAPIRIRLAIIDAKGHTDQVATLADYARDAFPLTENSVVARTAFDPTRARLYVGHVTRHVDSWDVGIDAFDVPSGSLVQALAIGSLPATGGLIAMPDVGEVLEQELVAPQVQIAPDGRHLVVRSALVLNQGPATSIYWSIALDAQTRMSTVTPWPSGGVTGSLDDCVGDSGFASASAYYLLCGEGLGSEVRRVDLAGRSLGVTPIPSEVQTYPLTSALDRRAGSLFLWSGVTRSIARVDLSSGALLGPITVPTPTAAGPMGALGALAGGISDWIAPSASAKVFLQPGIVISPDGSRAYALGLAHGEPGPLQSTGIYVFDAKTLHPLAHWSPTADYVSLALSADGSLLYAAGASGDLSVVGSAQASVTVFDAATGKIRLIAGQLGSSAIFFPPGGLLDIGG